MKLEQQVVSLELSKRLKKLGVKQESLFYWLEYNDGYSEVIYRPTDNKTDMGYSAFTVAELGEMLPDANCFKYEDKKYGWVDYGFSRYEGVWSVWIGRGGYGEEYKWEDEADTEANARAKMLIYLIENHLLNP